MKTLLPFLALCLLSCNEHPTGNTPPADTVAAPAAIPFDSLTGKLFHAPKREGLTQSRRQAPAFTLHSSCEDGLFRLWIVANRDISGNPGSVAITLTAPEDLAGSQLDGGTSPITDYQTDFDPPVVDWWTGGRRVTFMSARQINAMYGTSLKSPGSATQLIEGGNGQYREFKEGQRYILMEARYNPEYPDGWLQVANGEPGLLEELGATSVPYLSIGATNEI